MTPNPSVALRAELPGFLHPVIDWCDHALDFRAVNGSGTRGLDVGEAARRYVSDHPDRAWRALAAMSLGHPIVYRALEGRHFATARELAMPQPPQPPQPPRAARPNSATIGAAILVFSVLAVCVALLWWAVVLICAQIGGTP